LAGPRWRSDITDDHSPFEFSIALSGGSTTLRILTEPQAPRQPSLTASWRLAEDIHEELAGQWGAGLTGYHRVADLFEPAPSDIGIFSVWHSALLSETGGARLKVYLNPAIHGASNADDVVLEAMTRLGLAKSWRDLRNRISSRGGLDEVLYFSLDLTDASDARAKIYLAHRHSTAEELARVLEPCPGFSATSVVNWCQSLMGSRGPFLQRPPITCFAFGRGNLDLRTATLHLPVRCYGTDDLDIARCVCKLLLRSQQVHYMRALMEATERPLEAATGLQTYVSLRPFPGREAVTAYLAPQIYSFAGASPTTADPRVRPRSSSGESRRWRSRHPA